MNKVKGRKVLGLFGGEKEDAVFSLGVNEREGWDH